MRSKLRRLWVVVFLLLVAGCRSSGDTGGSDSGEPVADSAPERSLRIVSGSENKTLQPILERWGRENNAAVTMEYRGSVDIMLLLEGGNLAYDAVWPANALWTALGDKQKRVKDEQSIFWSPVVLGVKRSAAQQLGWIGKAVRVEDILRAAESGKLRYMMTSATQSNSGASAYLGYLYAFAGKPQVLTADNLAEPNLRGKITRILGTVNRSAGSSGWLKELFLQRFDDYDAMVNYEAVIIEANQQLAREGREPLHVVYPVDGLAIADSPLGFVDQGDAGKRELFQKLQAYLLTEPVQRELLASGRRVGPVGAPLQAADTAAFNPQWGIQSKEFLNQIRYPRAEVIRQALDLYQTAFRKPSFTVYCLDFSGSMRGERQEKLKSAMRLILNQEAARRNLLQASPSDTTVVITFSNRILNEWQVRGSDPAALSALWARINASQPEGGTDIYTPTIRAFQIFQERRATLEDAFPAVILLTDGESNTGKEFADFERYRQSLRLPKDIPVFGILFGDASSRQLDTLTETTSGRVFDGQKDLAAAFRDAKGYN